MIWILTIAVVLLAMALTAIIHFSVIREQRYQVIINDLLDRVMARSYGEYAAATKIAPLERARKRKYLDDAELAEMEKQARHEIGVLAGGEHR